MEMVKKLCEKPKIKSESGMVAPTDRYPVTEGVFDVRPWMNMFTYDAITYMFFSNCYGLLDQGNDSCPSLRDEGKLNTVPAMGSFHSGSAFNTTFGVLPEPWYKVAHTLLRYAHVNKVASTAVEWPSTRSPSISIASHRSQTCSQTCPVSQARSILCR